MVASRRVSADFSPTCVNHAAATARGLCATCHVAFCAECLTKVDGINFCAPCYIRAAQQARTFEAQHAPEAHFPRVASLALGLWLAVWGALELGFGGVLPP